MTNKNTITGFVECAGCGASLGTKEFQRNEMVNDLLARGEPVISHGTCPDCLEIQMAEIAAFDAAMTEAGLR